MWHPEIMYEEEMGGSSSKIPFIIVPKGQEMPKLLYIFESRDTGEKEPSKDGSEIPVFEMDLHQYADMSVLKTNLSPDVYDQVRFALGLESMTVASKKGAKITQSVRKNLE
jgi:hypothetical protein